MANKLLKNVPLYALGDFLPKIFAVVLVPIYTIYLSPSDYGIVYSMGVLIYFLVIFFTLAFDRSIYRLYFEYQNENDRKDLIGTIFYFTMLFSTISLILLIIFRNWVNLIFPSINFFPFFLYAILTSYFIGFQNLISCYLQLKAQAGLFTTFNIIKSLLAILFSIMYVLLYKQKAEGLIKAPMLASLILLPFVLIYSYKISNFTIKWDILKKVASFSLPILPNLIAVWVLNLSSRIFIEKYMKLSDVGIYSMAMTVVELFILFSASFGKAYNPIYYSLANSSDQYKAKNSLKLYNNYFIIISIVIIFFIALFSREAITILLNKRYHEAYKLIPLISLSYVIAIFHTPINFSIYQVKKTYILAIIYFGSAILNIILNMYLIPKFGMNGAIFALLYSNLFYTIIGYYVSKKHYFVPYNWLNIGVVISVGSGIILIFIYLSNMSLYVTLTIKSILSLIILFYFYKNYKVEILNFIKKEENI